MISGGGTGGHIFPAIAIANSLKKKHPDAEFLFVGALGRMEMEKVPEAGYKIEGLPIMGIQRRLTVKNLMLPFKLLKSMLKARKLIKEFKPHIAIGVGGYASGPLLRAANNAGVPTLLQEQNSFAGLTNKLLAKKAKLVCVAYPEMDKFFPKDRILITGNPVRSEVVKLDGKRQRALEFFNLENDKKVILVVGGSLGAWSINEGVGNSLKHWEKEGVQLIWQTGKLYHERAMEQAKPYENWVKVQQFIKRMDLAYAAADLVVSRAGAIAVSELCLVKKPSIFVPLPSAAEDHQTKNAMVLVNRQAASLIKDQEVKDGLAATVSDLLAKPEELNKMSERMESLGYHDAADLIADQAIKIMDRG